MQQKIKVGLDFDGVIAYNPFRVIRAPITEFKRKVLKKRGVKFFVPHNKWQRALWTILHESSVFPAPGVKLLREMVEKGEIEAHLVTARYSFLNQNLSLWLKKHGLEDLFTTINVNLKDEQPHLFKENTINKHKFDYFIEDNLDIVEHLERKCRSSICWVYNAVDRYLYPHRSGHTYLKNALEWIRKESKK